MAGKIFQGAFPKTSCSFSVSRFNSWRPIGCRFYSTSDKVEMTVKENFKEMQSISFEQFKNTKVKSFEEYKQSPRVKILFGSDMKKIADAYEDYCVCKFNRYRLVEHGGNPARMI